MKRIERQIYFVMLFVLVLMSFLNPCLFWCAAVELQHVCIDSNIFEVRHNIPTGPATEHSIENSIGEIVNLMSVDAQKLQDAPPFLHLLWSAPLVVGLCMYFLWQELGPSAMAGLLLVLFMIPFNAAFAEKMRKLQVTTGFVSPKDTAI